MVSVHTYSIEIKQLKSTIESQLKHAYLAKFIEKPFVNMDKIYIINNLYSVKNTPWVNKEKLITTTYLVDLALNTHDTIPSFQTNDEMNERELQLSVLAGDYYSAQYYYILSQLEEVNMISLLANAIKKTNENKMRLFYLNVDSIAEFFDVMKETESFIYQAIANHLNQTQLIPVINEFLLINKLIAEKELIKQNKQTPLLNYIKTTQLNNDHSSILSIINNQIEKCLHEIDELLIELPYQHADMKMFLTNRLNLNYQTNRSIAEEG